MGIPITKILKENLDELNKEFVQRFNTEIKIVDKIPREKKSSTLFEYFVLYNTILALTPIEIKIIMRNRQGPSFVPIVGIKYWKTLNKFGEVLEPSVSIKLSNKKLSLWFHRPFVFKNFGSLRPDILIREGEFDFKDKSYDEEAKVELFKDGELFAGAGINRPNKDFIIKEFPVALNSKPLCFFFKRKFLHPPIIIECKSFGGMLGNPQEYAEYAKIVAIVSPEKLYEPKKENIYIIRLENNKRLSNQDCREKLKSFFKKIKLL